MKTGFHINRGEHDRWRASGNVRWDRFGVGDLLCEDGGGKSDDDKEDGALEIKPET